MMWQRSSRKFTLAGAALLLLASCASHRVDDAQAVLAEARKLGAGQADPLRDQFAPPLRVPVSELYAAVGRKP